MTGILIPVPRPLAGPANPIVSGNYSVGPGVNYAYIEFGASGDVRRHLGTGAAGEDDIGDWLSPKAGMSNYSITMQLIAASHSPSGLSGTFGAALELFEDRLWRIDANSVRTNPSAELAYEIRRISDNALLGTGNVYLSAAYDAGGGGDPPPGPPDPPGGIDPY